MRCTVVTVLSVVTDEMYCCDCIVSSYCMRCTVVTVLSVVTV